MALMIRSIVQPSPLKGTLTCDEVQAYIYILSCRIASTTIAMLKLATAVASYHMGFV